MLEPGAHWGYVIAAYAATAVVLGALVWASVAEGRRARRALERIEAERGR
jgi:heme exporter protein CcmD